MNQLQQHVLDMVAARIQLNEYVANMKPKPNLSERNDVLPFFKASPDLSLLIAEYLPGTLTPNAFAFEYTIYGHFIADLIVGDSNAGAYLLVEFEDGSPNSMFKTKAKKANRDWAPRFEGAFSQLVDWMWKLEDMRNTHDFELAFKRRDVSFQGLVVAGKGMNLAPLEIARLKWRNDKVKIDSKSISCISFDELESELDFRLIKYGRV